MKIEITRQELRDIVYCMKVVVGAWDRTAHTKKELLRINTTYIKLQNKLQTQAMKQEG